MLIKDYIVIFIKNYIYFRVIYLLENCYRLCFSIEEIYVYYEFIRLYTIKKEKKKGKTFIKNDDAIALSYPPPPNLFY